METEKDKPLHQRLYNTQKAALASGLIIILSSIFSFIIAFIFIIKSSQVEFLSEFYLLAGILIILMTTILLIPGLMFLKFAQNKMANSNGTSINYRFNMLRNTLVALCVIFGIVRILAFIGGAVLFLEEFTRNLRQY